MRKISYNIKAFPKFHSLQFFHKHTSYSNPQPHTQYVLCQMNITNKNIAWTHVAVVVVASVFFHARQDFGIYMILTWTHAIEEITSNYVITWACIQFYDLNDHIFLSACISDFRGEKTYFHELWRVKYITSVRNYLFRWYVEESTELVIERAFNRNSININGREISLLLLNVLTTVFSTKSIWISNLCYMRYEI